MVGVICAMTASTAKGTLGLYLYLAILPFSYLFRRLLFLATDVSRTEWLMAAAVPDAILFAAMVGWIARYRLRILATRSLLPVSLFLGWCVIEVFNPRASLLTGMAGFKKTAMYISLYYLGAAVTAVDRSVITKIGKITVTCGVIAAGYGVLQAWRGLAAFELAPIIHAMGKMTEQALPVLYVQDFLRPFSTFSGPWIFGDYLVIGLLFGLLLFGTGKQSMRWFLIATASLLLGLAVSLSRSSYVMLICCLGLIFVLAGRSRMSRVIRASAVVILVGTLTVAVINYQGRTAPGAPAAVLAMFNVVGRFERWQILLYDTSTYSMIGQGIGSIQAAYAFGEQFVEEAHSFLFDLLLEVGVVGLVLFAWVCVAVFSQALRAIRVVGFEADRQELIVVVAILGGMLMAKSAAGGLWGMQVHDTYWWLLCGVVAGLSARQHRNIRSLTGCRRKNPARIV